MNKAINDSKQYWRTSKAINVKTTLTNVKKAIKALNKSIERHKAVKMNKSHINQKLEGKNKRNPKYNAWR